MELTWHTEQGIVVIVIAGELDATHQEHVHRTVDQLISEGYRQFVMDLARVEFIDSAGLVMLIRCLKRIRSQMGDIYLTNLQSEVLCILKLTRLDGVFQRFSDVTLAIQHFQQGLAAPGSCSS